MHLLNPFKKVPLAKPQIADAALSQQWDRINQAYEWHDKGSRYWSFAFHTTFGLAALASVLVTLISGHPGVAVPWFGGKVLMGHNALVGALSAVAALLTSLGGFGGLERKWRANRVTRSRLWLLLVEVETTSPKAVDIKKELDKVIEEHDLGILGPKPKDG